MTETRREPDVAWTQQTALLGATLKRIARYAAQMENDLRDGHVNLAHADQLGHATLTVLKQASVIADRAEQAAKESPRAKHGTAA
jgi:hypothetical protein